MNEIRDLLQKAFEENEKTTAYYAGSYALRINRDSPSPSFALYSDWITVLRGNINDKEVRFCVGQNICPYGQLISAVEAALPEFHFAGDIYEQYLLACNPKENGMRYAAYFCGDFHEIISEEEYALLKVSGELEHCDTMDYAPIFDGIVYPTLADSSAAQIAAFGYHYDDDRRILDPHLFTCVADRGYSFFVRAADLADAEKTGYNWYTENIFEPGHFFCEPTKQGDLRWVKKKDAIESDAYLQAQCKVADRKLSLDDKISSAAAKAGKNLSEAAKNSLDGLGGR